MQNNEAMQRLLSGNNSQQDKESPIFKNKTDIPDGPYTDEWLEQALKEAGVEVTDSEFSDGITYFYVHCPNEAAHTVDGDGHEMKVYIYHGYPVFKCHHGHCTDIKFKDYAALVGIPFPAEQINGITVHTVPGANDSKKKAERRDYKDLVRDLMEAARIQQFGKALYRMVDGKYYKILGDIFINHELIAIRGMEPEKQKAAQTMIRSFQKEENIKFDRFYTGFRNGIMNWRTGEFTPYGDQSTPIFRYFDVNYNPEADTSFVDSVITDWCQGDSEKKEMLYELAGCCLYTDKPIKKWWAIEGKADTGKTTFIGLLLAIIGKDNVGNTPIQKLKDTNAIAELIDKPVNIVDDGSSKYTTDLSYLRRIIQGDTIQVKLLYQNLFSVRIESRMVFVFNKTPRFRDDNDATAKKMLTIGFNRIYSSEEKDITLLDKLITEENKEAFVFLAVERMRNVLNRNLTFTVSEESRRITAQIIQESDQFASFAADTISEDYTWRQFLEGKRTEDVYDDFRKWALDEGYNNILVRKQFTERCCKESGATAVQSHGHMFYRFR